MQMLLDAGSQVLVSIIRGLALGDVTLKNCFGIIKKEFLSSIIMSLFIGLVAFLRAYLLQGNINISFTVGLTMAFVVILSALTGLFLPLFSKK